MYIGDVCVMMCGIGNLSKNRFQILSRLLTNI